MQLKKFIYLSPSPYLERISLASRQVLLDGIKFSSEMHFIPVILGKRYTLAEAANYYLKMIKWWRKAEVVLTIYPYICISFKRSYLLRRLESILIKWLSKSAYSILYIVDLPADRELVRQRIDIKMYNKANKIEKCIFESFDILLVFNENMKKRIQEKYGFNDEKFLLFEMLDYGVYYKPAKGKGFEKPVKVVFLSSNLNERDCSWIKNIPCSRDVVYSFFGNDGEWINKLSRGDMVYCGVISPKDVPKVASEYHFGLIYYDPSIKKYLQYGSTSKFSAYIAAGLPVICPSSFSYISYLIQKYKVGLTFNSLNDITKILAEINEEEYIMMREKSAELGEKIRNGYFFKKAVNLALHEYEKTLVEAKASKQVSVKELPE